MSKEQNQRSGTRMPVLMLLALFALLPAKLHAADGDTFSYTYGGQTLRYTVLSETDKTAATSPGNEGVNGKLILPGKVVSDDNVEYTLTKIGELSFRKCAGMTSVDIPNTVTEIGEFAFESCEGMKSMDIPASVTQIGERAFTRCFSLERMNFISPNPQLDINADAFASCAVPIFSFDGDYTIKPGVFDKIVQSYTTLEFHGNYVIDESAFEGVTFDALYLYGKSDIGDKAFRNTNIKSVYIEDCYGIGKYAFASDRYPHHHFMLWCFNEQPPFVADKNAFEGLPKQRVSQYGSAYTSFYVPCDAINAYSQAYGWDYFEHPRGMGTLESLTFTPSIVHLDLRNSVSISYEEETTDDYEITDPIWYSSDENVAIVNPVGAVQARSSGMALIYFSFTDGYSLKHNFKATLVTAGEVDFSLTVEPLKSSIHAGETTEIKTAYGGRGYTVVSETWASSDAGVATVDENGVVTAVAEEGEADIILTVTFDNGLSIDKRCRVNVTRYNGVDEIETDGRDAPAGCYNLSGSRVDRGAAGPGLYIIDGRKVIVR